MQKNKLCVSEEMRERFKNYVNTLATIKLDEVCVLDLHYIFCLRRRYKAKCSLVVKHNI